MLRTLEYTRYLIYYAEHSIFCSWDEWQRRQQVKLKLRNYGYEVEEVPNPTRLNAYKDKEWFLIDVNIDSIGVMQFMRGDTTGRALRGRPYWEETLDLLRSFSPVLTPFNILHSDKNRKLIEVW